MRSFFISTAAVLLAGAGLLQADTGRSFPLPDGVLTNAAQVRHLTADQAARAIPARLRGVVVDVSQPREKALILADETACLYVVAETNIFARFHPRDLVEVDGVSSKGEFAPCVLVTNVTALALGHSPIPDPRPTTYQELITGSLDAQFVEITGVVRQVLPAQPEDDTWRILLAANGGLVPVRIPLPQDPLVQEDAEVKVQAVCLYQFNKKRQALNPVLQVPHERPVYIVKPSPADPFDAPLQPLDSLQQFSPEMSFGHRVHVRGVVTLCQPDSQIWIHDDSSGLRIQTRQTDDLQPGDEIEALGFPGFGNSSPVLEDAVYKKTGQDSPSMPLKITNPSEAYDHQDDLVSIEATLTGIQPVMSGLVLTLERGDTAFKAILKQPFRRNPRPDWQIQSVVRAAGICDVVYDNARPVMGVWHPQSFQLLMRAPSDLTVLRAPPWWTARHIVLLLSLFTCGLLLAGAAAAWAGRRRLREQARNRKMAEAQFTAVLAERNRLAREIHDTLAQGFTATLLQLQLVRYNAKNETLGLHLDQAEHLIRGSLQEARNSIWQMSPQVLETGDLVAALKEILGRLSDGTVPTTHFSVAGHERRLPPIVESNVLRVGQEAITNAVKHAGARTINVSMAFAENQFTLSVEDDGRGFDPANPPRSEGGFGLVGMKGRADELNGQLKVRTAPNSGTEIILSVPLAGLNDTRMGE
jgi:signal transduction histidine kinase